MLKYLQIIGLIIVGGLIIVSFVTVGVVMVLVLAVTIPLLRLFVKHRVRRYTAKQEETKGQGGSVCIEAEYHEVTSEEENNK